MSKTYTYLRVEHVQSDEHMLFASELAMVYRIFTVKKIGDSYKVNVAHTALVAAYIKDYAERNGIEPPDLFYLTKSGLSRVYPESLYRPAIAELIGQFKGDVQVIKVGKKNYSYVVLK